VSGDVIVVMWRAGGVEWDTWKSNGHSANNISESVMRGTTWEGLGTRKTVSRFLVKFIASAAIRVNMHFYINFIALYSSYRKCYKVSRKFLFVPNKRKHTKRLYAFRGFQSLWHEKYLDTINVIHNKLGNVRVTSQFPRFRSFLTHFPYFEKKKEAFDITMLFLCMCLLLVFFVFCAVRVVSKTSRRLTFSRTKKYVQLMKAGNLT
jgi:hypothetical protein